MNNEWISVKDDLPEHLETVLVHIGNKFGCFKIATGCCIRQFKIEWQVHFDDNESAGHYISEYITHWMPLPEPPKP